MYIVFILTSVGIAVASYNLGCFCGAIFCIWIGNYLGRRKTIFTGSIIMVIGATLQSCAYSLPHLIVGRIVTGIGNGMNTSTVPTWQSGEFLHPICYRTGRNADDG
jgi:MFS family permease